MNSVRIKKLTNKASETKNLLINKIIEKKKAFFHKNTQGAMTCDGTRDCAGRCGV